MNPDIQTKHLRRGFIALASIGLVFNVLLDIDAFLKKRESDLYGEKVVHSYEAQNHLRLLIGQLNEAHKHKDYSFELNAIEKNMEESQQIALIKNLSAMADTQPQQALQLAREIARQENTLLQKRITKDLEQNRAVETSMMRTLYLDFALLGILLFLFLLNAKAKKKIEHNLQESLKLMQETLLNLEEEKLRQRVLMKTTVHDLKNPIGSIFGFAEILKEEASSKDSVLQFSEMIRKISRRSLDLVETILEEEKHLSSSQEPLNIVDTLKDVCAQLQVQAQKKYQSVSLQVSDANIFIAGNRLKIDELLNNLIGNAIKYSPPSSPIQISCKAISGKVFLEISDKGPGFSQEDKLRAFQYGQKLSAQPTGNETSSGLGLYVAKQIVDTHHGQIHIKDVKPGPGAHLCVEFPLHHHFQQTLTN